MQAGEGEKRSEKARGILAVLSFEIEEEIAAHSAELTGLLERSGKRSVGLLCYSIFKDKCILNGVNRANIQATRTTETISR